MTAKIFLLLLLLSFAFKEAYLYSHNTGFKYFRNYSLEGLGLEPQNWAILQDKRGIIYVGNHDGMAIYDGAYWRTINIPNQTVRSLAIDDKGTIYIGGKNEIGYLTPSENGALEYVSLLEYVNENQRNFGNVWKTHFFEELIYFKTSKYLLCWNPTSGQMHVRESEELFLRSFVCKKGLYVLQKGVGLMHITEGSLKLVPGGEIFVGKRITMMAPYDDHRLLIGTFSDGFYLYDGSILVNFSTQADEYVKENKLYHGIGLLMSPGDFLLATQRGGAVTIDFHGRVKHIFNKTWGIQDDNVRYVFEDFQGNLWLALINGLTKIEYTSPISIYDNRNNLPGLVLSVVRHGPYNDLFVGTISGLYSLDAEGKFQLVLGVTSMCWFLLSMEHSLLAATTDGVFQVENNVKHKVTEATSFVLHRCQKDVNRVWVGTIQGLISLYLDQGNQRWSEEYQFESITDHIRTIVEDQKGNIWLGTLTKGVLNVNFRGDLYQPELNRYDTKHGLPRGETNVFMAAGHVMVGTDKGLFRFDEKTNGFIPDTTLGKEFANGSRNVFRLVEDREKNIWFHSNQRNFQAIAQQDGTFVSIGKPFLRIPAAQVNCIYFDPSDDATWFASHKGLFRYDNRIKKDYHLTFQMVIHKVLINGNLVFDGFNAASPNGFYPIIDYKDRNIRFMFAAPFFEAENRTRYQCFLEGYEKDWSAFSSETWKDYTNLDAGLYTFRVRGQNVYENLSEETIYQFKVLPPWYQTWWAILIYTFLAFLGVYFIVKWRSWKLVREKRKLEQVIRERTKEINEKNLQLEEQSEKLKEMDQIKSRFFANISHEFRTPLTLIMGPIEQRLSLCRDKQQEKELNMMLRNSQRLLSLINQLLDLSKLDSGKMKLQAARQNIIPFLKGLVGSFESMVVQKPLDLTFQTKEENISLYYDTEKLEKVICNLISNAVKFTPPKGKITVSAKKYNAGEKNYPEGYLEISFRDTGIGIPESQLPYIFDRFYQADGSSAHEHQQKGSGIGLALVKELVTFHHGDISVHSSEGKGTEFIIRLPLGKAHLKPDEIFSDVELVENLESETQVYQREQKQSYEVPTDDMIEKEEEQVDKPQADEVGEEEKNVILVVDDSADVRTFIKSSLEHLYTIVEAADGREGIAKAKAIIPDLIVSDVMMPNVDGFELCQVLKTDIKTSHIPVILLTAKASEESIIEGLETGADDYITKPFNTKILLTRIKNLIDLRCQLQENIQREMMLQPTEIAVSSMDQEFMKELKKAVEKNMSEEEFGVDELAKGLYMSRATLNRKLRALTGESTNQFIQSYRLKRAAQLLKTNFGNVTEVAFEVGFSNSAYFTKCFKEKFHQLPHTLQVSESGSP